MTKRLKKQYGNKVKCVFVDIASAEMGRYPHLAQLLQDKDLPLPVVAVDGQICLVATFAPALIIKEIEKRLHTSEEPSK